MYLYVSIYSYIIHYYCDHHHDDYENDASAAISIQEFYL